MTDVALPLSVGAVRQLTTQLKAFSRALKDDVKVDIEQATCEFIAQDVRAGIASIADVDGNYLGSDNPNANVVVEVGLQGHDVIWRGQQIAFLEFGTGAAGASGSYAGATGGYHPDPSKVAWVYRDIVSGDPEVSYGLVPQAPMLNAAVAARRVGALIPARDIVKGRLLSAVTV